MKKVAVIMGGVSSEREISLLSGRAVAQALSGAGLEVSQVVLDTERLEGLPAGTEAAFIALHGGYGENGGVQADLDRLGIPYTGPGAAASRVTIDKIATKRRLIAAGIPTPVYEVLPPGAAGVTLPLPVVVKPPRDGSSVGIARVERSAELDAAIEAARALDARGEVLIEEYVPGREWTVGVLDGRALPVVEIRASGGWYGFQEKYASTTTEYLFPETSEDVPLCAVCQVLALAAFQATGCRGVARVDFRISPEGEPYVLELNTVPGFTQASLLPKAAARAGISFERLCVELLNSAACG